MTAITQLQGFSRLAPYAADGHIIVLLGPPLGGKSSVAQLLREQYAYVSISPGDYARANDLMIQEGMAPEDRIRNYVQETITECMAGDFEPFVLDGFPRTFAQLALMLQWTRDKHLVFAIVGEHTTAVDATVRAFERGRNDDTPLQVFDRHKHHEKHVQPVIDMVSNQRAFPVIYLNETNDD